MRKHWIGAALSFGFLMCLTGCGGDDDRESDNDVPAVTSSANSTVAPTSAPGESAAADLYGSWLTELADGSNLRLTLQEGTYRASSPGGTGFGQIAVRGDEIEFLDSNYCPGERGLYRWSVEDGTLSFTPLGQDPCGRVDFLVGTTYERLP